MAVAPQLDDATRSSIADQIGQMLPPVDQEALAFADEPQLSLGESLPIMVLPLDAVRRGTEALSEAVRFTGRWHHQVEAPEGFVSARSVDRGEEHEVVEVAASTIPDDLARTIRWIDENMPGDQVAVMLIVPDYYLTAIMLRGADGDQVVVSQAPERLAELRPDQVYEGRQFISLVGQYPPSAGIPDEGQFG